MHVSGNLNDNVEKAASFLEKVPIVLYFLGGVVAVQTFVILLMVVRARGMGQKYEEFDD